MNNAALRLSTFGFDPGDQILHIELFATDGRFSAAEEFQEVPSVFSNFADELLAFPRTRSHQAVFEAGSLKGNAAYYARLKVYLFDAVGHVAVEISVDNRRANHLQTKASFNIHCEVAAINRLGKDLKQWISAPDSVMIWQPEQKDV